MKHRICISIDEQTIYRMRETMRSREFRNKSHLVEYALEQFLEKRE